MFKKYNVSATYKLYFLYTKSIGFEKTYQGFVVTTPQKDHEVIQSKKLKKTYQGFVVTTPQKGSRSNPVIINVKYYKPFCLM